MIERHLARLRRRHDISAADAELIVSALGEVRDIPAGQTVIPAGKLLDYSTLLLGGIMCRFKDLRDGQRQISELHVPGDFADLHSYSLKRLDHSILALSNCRIVIVPHDDITRIIDQSHNLMRAYWFSTNLDAAIHREWVLSLGRRTAMSRMAALFCELQVRLEIVGLADRTGFDLELNQTELAECLGLTAVHVNRTLKELRSRELMTFRQQRVVIHDLDGLWQVGEFDPTYLYLNKEPA